MATPMLERLSKELKVHIIPNKDGSFEVYETLEYYLDMRMTKEELNQLGLEIQGFANE